MKTFADESFDSIVTDPPYELGFMGKGWDSSGIAYDVDVWRECFRVLKPGGFLLAFGGSRTWHRIAVAIEDAGFEVRDSIAWLYGSGFPKSLDVAKAIDRVRSEDRAPVDAVRTWLNDRRLAAGLSHDAVNKHFGHASNGGGSSSAWMTNPTSRGLPTWEQWVALKALFGFDDEMDSEVWRLNGKKGRPGDNFVNREVLAERVVERKGGGWADMAGSGRFKRGEKVIRDTASATDAARAWEGWGTALKPAFEPIIVARKPLRGTVAANVLAHGTGALNIDATRVAMSAEDRQRIDNMGGFGKIEGHVPNDVYGKYGPAESKAHEAGRWPTNVVLDESQATALDEQTGVLTSGKLAAHHARNPKEAGILGAYGSAEGERGYGDSGGASRFFPTFRYEAKAPGTERPEVDGVQHATVKPLELMRWLVRLVTRPGGRVLDLFAGSGTTGEAALLEGMEVDLIELEADHLPLILARVRKPLQPSMFGDWDEAAS
jgi:hypothetical protein